MISNSVRTPARGRPAEDMERNARYVMDTMELRDGTADLVARGVDLANTLLAGEPGGPRTTRGSRKAHQRDVKEEIRFPPDGARDTPTTPRGP